MISRNFDEPERVDDVFKNNNKNKKNRWAARMTEMTKPEGWLDEYGDDLYRYALMRVRDAAIAEDLVQETFLAALKARANFEQRSSQKTWLIGILKHKIIDYFRKDSRESLMENTSALDRELTESYFDQHGHWKMALAAWPAPDKALEESQFWVVLQECIDQLPKRMAAAFLLREIDGLSNEEICKVLDISTTNNLWVTLSRTRVRMRQCLETRWFSSYSERGGQ